VTDPETPRADRNRSMTALIVMTIVVLVFAALIALYMYGLQGIGA
jgi:flagellar basal body-associated protein FliL